MAVSERPQQRLEHFGVSALSDTELLALALQGNGLRPEQALDVAARLLATAGSVASLLAWTPGDYRRLPGISATKAAQLAATAELARRIMLGSIPQQPVLNRPELIAAHLAPLAAGLEVEKFWVLCLNRKNRLLKRVELTSGTATSALAHPRDVFRAALRENAVAIICAHNHPSGVMPRTFLCRVAGNPPRAEGRQMRHKKEHPSGVRGRLGRWSQYLLHQSSSALRAER